MARIRRAKTPQIAADYDAGTSNLGRWKQRMDYIHDPLLFIETLPALETRLIVERVLTDLWIYRQRFTQAAPTLRASASGRWPANRALDQRAQKVASKHVPARDGCVSVLASDTVFSSTRPTSPRRAPPRAAILYIAPAAKRRAVWPPYFAPRLPAQGGEFHPAINASIGILGIIKISLTLAEGTNLGGINPMPFDQVLAHGVCALLG